MNLGLSILETFSSLYYIHNANFDFVNMESEIFSKNVGMTGQVPVMGG